MRRLVLLLTVVMGIGMVLTVSTTDVAAQTLRPCCEGGGQENKPCQNDNQCKGLCVGGFRDGKICLDDSKCPAACIGGTNDGGRCSSDVECPGGTCGQAGFCDQGTCTALCVKGKPPKSPSDPASEWLELDAANRVVLQHTCP